MWARRFRRVPGSLPPAGEVGAADGPRARRRTLADMVSGNGTDDAPAGDTAPEGTAPGLPATVALYALARLALLAVIAALLSLTGLPVLLAILLGLVMALPLSMVVFRGLRARLDLALAESGRRRGAEREALRSKLRGDEPFRSEGEPERQADPGPHRPGQ